VTTLKRISLLLALGACLAAAGCGSDDEQGAPIPANQAAALERELQSIQNRLDEGSVGACEDIFQHPTDPNRPAVEQILASLPPKVDPDVRSALEQSFENLWELAQQECDEKAADRPTQTQTQTQPEPETDTTETPTETTETTPPETDTETTPDQETLPPEGDGENGGAIPETGGNNGGGVGPGATKLKQQGKEKP
jgi:hypothetical protein